MVATAVLAVVAAIGLRARVRPVTVVVPVAASAAPGAPATPLVRPVGLPQKPRVVVFSPHPDDETIAVGGLIHRLAHAKVPVEIVFVTNGDGYPEAVKGDFHLTKPTDEDYLALGELRQREALAAARHLGVGKPDVRFLGFPDGGLAELWAAHWSRARPYTSPYTKEDSVPYEGTVDTDAEYDGQDLTSVITHLLRDFRPNVVVMPHPYDSHSDHLHTSYFVTEAMSTLEERGVLPKDMVVLTYLVHYPSWPALRGPTFDYAYPVASVPFTVWRETDLSPTELAAKRAALAEYKSQLEVMNGFLRLFLSRNELFGSVDGKILAKIASIH